MAIAITQLTLGKSEGADPSTASITPAETTGSMVLLWIGASNASGPAPVDDLVISGGGTWIKITTGTWAGRRRSWLYVCKNWSGGADTIDMLFGGTDPEQWIWTVEDATGLNTSTPYDPQIASYYLASGKEAPPVLLTMPNVPETLDMTYSCVHLENNRTDLAATGYTASYQSAIATLGVRRVETAYKSNAPTTEWDWTTSEGIATFALRLLDPSSTLVTDLTIMQIAGDTGSPFTVALGSSPVEGNLLIAILLERQPSPQPTPSMTTSGYTLIDVERFSDLDSTHRRGHAIYYKVAGAGESSLVEAAWTGGPGTAVMYVMEIATIGAFRSNFDYSDNGDVVNETVFTSDAIATAANAVIVAFTYYKGQSGTPDDSGLSVTYDSGFDSADAYTTGVGFTFAIGGGIVEKASSGSYSVQSTLASDNTANRNITNIMLEFAAIVEESGRSKTMILR